MNCIKASVLGLLLTSNLIYSAIAASATGTVILRNKDHAICSLPVPEPGTSKSYSLVNEPVACGGWNDIARTIQLTEVPSATKILVAGNRNCWDDDAEIWFLLKTIKKLTDTTIIEIEYLATFGKDQIIEPGLQMVDLNTKDNNRDQISCVRITTSAAPPSPSVAKP